MQGEVKDERHGKVVSTACRRAHFRSADLDPDTSNRLREWCPREIVVAGWNGLGVLPARRRLREAQTKLIPLKKNLSHVDPCTVQTSAASLSGQQQAAIEADLHPAAAAGCISGSMENDHQVEPLPRSDSWRPAKSPHPLAVCPGGLPWSLPGRLEPDDVEKLVCRRFHVTCPGAAAVILRWNRPRATADPRHSDDEPRRIEGVDAMAGSAMEFTTDNFQSEVLDSDVPVLVDFWAPWCGPCRMIGPTIEELAAENKGTVKVGKLNVDDNGDIAMQYQVSSIPALMIFKGGRLVQQFMGVQPKVKLQQALDECKA